MNRRANPARGAIALTGATGFVGGRLLTFLADQGHQVRALTRRPQPEIAGVTWISGDLSDKAALERLVSGTQAVIHCAGAVKAQHPSQFDVINAAGVKTVLSAAHAHSEEGARFVLISSLAARMAHLSPYAASKRRGEEYLETYDGHLHWSVIRPPAVYGPGDREVRKLLDAARFGILPAPGNTRHRFALLHVDDLAGLVGHLLENQDMAGGQHFEIDDGAPAGYDYHEIAAILEAIVGRKVVPVSMPSPILRLAAGVNRGLARLRRRPTIFTPDKLGELLHPDWTVSDSSGKIPGWNPQIRADEGLRRLFTDTQAGEKQLRS